MVRDHSKDTQSIRLHLHIYCCVRKEIMMFVCLVIFLINQFSNLFLALYILLRVKELQIIFCRSPQKVCYKLDKTLNVSGKGLLVLFTK